MLSKNVNYCCLVTKSCLTLSQLHGLKPTRLLCPWDFPGKTTEVDEPDGLQSMGLQKIGHN